MKMCTVGSGSKCGLVVEPLIGCVPLGKSLSFSESCFPHISNALNFVHKVVGRPKWDKMSESSSQTSQPHRAERPWGSGALCSFTTFSSTTDWALAAPLRCEPGRGSQETWEHRPDGAVNSCGLRFLSSREGLGPGHLQVPFQGLMFPAELDNLWSSS